MARIYVFDDLSSLFHFILGIVCSVITHTWLWPLAHVIFLSFIFYQLIEYENPISTIGDFVEFMLGVCYGFIIVATLL